MPISRIISTASIEKHELRNTRLRLRACSAKPCHCGGELHAPPIIKAGGVLIAEGYAEWFVASGFGFGDVRLELDRIEACVGDDIDEGVGKAERAVMGLRHLGDEQGTAALPNLPSGDLIRPGCTWVISRSP